MGATASLPWEVTADVEGTYSYQPHDRPTSFPDPDSVAGLVPAVATERRRDHIWTATGVVAKPIGERLVLSARYRYFHANSNADFFDYDRHIVGTYLRVNLH